MKRFLSVLRAHRWLRYLGMVAAITAALLAAAIVSTLTVDLGPSVRSLAEQEGSRRLRRPVHIGRLGIHVLRGRAVIEDLLIEGRSPGDRPFFTAARLSAGLDWMGLLQRRPDILITSVELTDWRMLVERWHDGHNFPRFAVNDERGGPRGPRRFTTTLRYFEGTGGQFAYEDHQTPWSILAPSVTITIGNTPRYEGQLSFDGGTVAIQNYLPMWANMSARFAIDGRRIQLDRIDLETDGASSVAVGAVDIARWPEMQYEVTSHVNFPRMRQIFFAKESWKLGGDGDFKGTFSLFKGGHDLVGRFESQVAEVNGYSFPKLSGNLHWTKNDFTITEAGARLFGGDARFGFAIAPLGSAERPRARFDLRYAGVDLETVAAAHALPGLVPAGTASGHNLLEWTLGRFREASGRGQFSAVPPPGERVLGPDDDGRDIVRIAGRGRTAPPPLTGPIPMAADAGYHFDGGSVQIDRGRFATAATHVTFEGATAWGQQSQIRFHVRSGDWQESDLVLAGLLTDFGARTGPVAFGGAGEFDGVMTGTFRRPRVAGVFSGTGMRAWDTLWGDGRASIVVENGYVTVTDGVIAGDESGIRAEGLFSLGYPRRDGGEEIDARFRVTRRDLDGLRHAFQIDDYPVSGRMTGEFHLTGKYEAPLGFGAMTIDDGVAYGEPFQKGTASLRFDGTGVRLDRVNLATASGTMTGAAFVGWDGTYAFNAEARGIAAEQVAAFSYPQAQPSGLIEFTASGSGTFEQPRYDVRFRVNDLFVAAEQVGQVTGTLTLRGQEVSGAVDVASPRLAITGTGRISLAAGNNAELSFRFHDSSLDPYVRLFVPRLSEYTTAVATGTMRIAGPLADRDRLLVDAIVERVDMKLLDYALGNAGPIRLALDQNVVQVRELQLAGEGTQLRVSGRVGLTDRTIAVRAAGDANLDILQAFMRDVRGSGRAQLSASIDGPLDRPEFSGNATIVDGRVRHFGLPNSLDGINGTIHFDSRGLRLDDLTAVLGGGRVQFGGRVDLDGYLPGELNVLMRGEDIHLRYPAGVRSTVDADLAVRGNLKAPTLGGKVTVKNALWSRRVDPTGGILSFGGGAPGDVRAPVAAAPLPLRFDLQIAVPSTLRIENNLARLVAEAELQLRGTYDRPQLFGRAEVDRGEVMFEGRRYLVTRGAIEFTNPSRIEPFFDIEAETRIRVPGQTYRVVVNAVGTTERLQPELSSDPPLPAADVLALLFSDVRRTDRADGLNNVELRALQNPNERQRDILTTRATQLLANPLASEVGRVVEQTFGVDTFQLTPTLIDPYSQSTATRVNPSARVTIGKRISDRVFLTFSRSLSSSLNDQILLLEYDESDRFSWILSRNEDQTYAIEVRVRHTF